MATNPEKDFGPIADDYAFFEDHATESREDIRAYVEDIQRMGPAEGTIRMLDFGCGSGTVTARFLEQIGWSPGRLHLTLVEPVEAARRQAVARVTGLTSLRVIESPGLPSEIIGSFDVILANHVFYYVPDLQNQLARLISALSVKGVFTTAIAGPTNALIEFWITGFRLLGRPVPYSTSEDVEAALRAIGADYDRRQVAYELTFPDTEENRMRILRFLLADYLPEIPLLPLWDIFDQYSLSGQIKIRTTSDHFTICSKRAAPQLNV